MILISVGEEYEENGKPCWALFFQFDDDPTDGTENEAPVAGNQKASPVLKVCLPVYFVFRLLQRENKREDNNNLVCGT